MNPKTPALHLVTPGDPSPPTPAERVRALLAEARAVAGESIQAYATALLTLRLQALEIAEGGDAYPAGVRDRARRFAEACETEAAGIRAIAERQA